MNNNIIYFKEIGETIVSLSDSIVGKIEKRDDNFVLLFRRNGYWVRDNSGTFQRYPNTMVELGEVNFENGSIECFSRRKMADKIYYEKEYISYDELTEKVNSQCWKLEIVQEYDYSLGSLFSCRLSKENERVDCYIRIEHKKKMYGIRNE